MKILVIDDREANRQSALDQLGVEHEVTVANGYDAAMSETWQPWDVVLTDAMMPFDRSSRRNESWFGEEAMVGIGIAMRALKKARFVAVVFSNHHHQNAEGEILEDCYHAFDARKPLVTANGARLAFVQDLCVCSECNGRGEHRSTCSQQGPIGKNWAKALAELLK